MIKFYRIVLLLVTLIFLTTYSPIQIHTFSKKKNFFFEIKNIEVNNNDKINESDIVEKLNHIYGKNIIFIDSDDISTPLESISFLKKIEVKKKYPNTIIIKVNETKPVAILFKKNNKYLLDSLSNLIVFNDGMNVDNFPSIFGKEAEKDFINFFKQLEVNKFPRDEIKNYYYFPADRWDLELANEQIIKFPSKKREAAIQQSVELLNREDFKNYKVIDLRIHGKIVVE